MAQSRLFDAAVSSVLLLLTLPLIIVAVVGSALALRTSIEATKQYQRNIHDAQGWQETAEIALSDITDSIKRAGELGIIPGSMGARSYIVRG